VDGEGCPECGKPTSIIKEESYFFKLSKFEAPLLKWIDENPKAILPKSRRNEVIRFIEQGLEDLSITRTSFSWGVGLPESVNDPKHVVYVWLDALMNYITALGYAEDSNKMDEFWPASYHLIGKDILRFHAIFWPAFLMSLELPEPTCIAAHGWWTRDGEKMSKSRGNVVKPKLVADAYGLENFRYFMLREVPFGQGGDFAQKALIDRINNDLGNDLGNLLNRIIGMSHKYFDGKIGQLHVQTYFSDDLKKIDENLALLDGYMQEVQLNRYLEEVWKIISYGNKAIEANTPWSKMKEGREEEVDALLGYIANLLAKVSLALHPVMPNTTQKIASALGFEINAESFTTLLKEGNLLADFVIEKIPPLFPKIETP
jgi:methionyl-tRNA synthetase